MKYLVNIESLDYTRQRNLEQKYQTAYLKNQKDETEIWAVLDDEEEAQKMEETIRAFNEFFELKEEQSEKEG